jgi:hypothetical protein
MRWTQAVSLGQCTGADGEGVWFWRPDAGAKVANDGGKRARSPGEHEVNRQNHCAGKAG